jgi:hypothetical protein
MTIIKFLIPFTIGKKKIRNLSIAGLTTKSTIYKHVLKNKRIHQKQKEHAKLHNVSSCKLTITRTKLVHKKLRTIRLSSFSHHLYSTTLQERERGKKKKELPRSTAKTKAKTIAIETRETL